MLALTYPALSLPPATKDPLAGPSTLRRLSALLRHVHEDASLINTATGSRATGGERHRVRIPDPYPSSQGDQGASPHFTAAKGWESASGCCQPLPRTDREPVGRGPREELQEGRASSQAKLSPCIGHREATFLGDLHPTSTPCPGWPTGLRPCGSIPLRHLGDKSSMVGSMTSQDTKWICRRGSSEDGGLWTNGRGCLSSCSLDSRHPINCSQQVQRPAVSNPHPESLTMCHLPPDLSSG